jgi:hypothetical protein
MMIMTADVVAVSPSTDPLKSQIIEDIRAEQGRGASSLESPAFSGERTTAAPGESICAEQCC